MARSRFKDIPAIVDTLSRANTLDASTCGNAKQAIASIEGTRPVALAYDGNLEALLTCIFVAFSTGALVEDIKQGDCIQMRLGQQVVPVSADADVAARVQRSICRSLGIEVWQTIFVASASDSPEKAMDIYRFLRSELCGKRTQPCNACMNKATCAHPCKHIPRNHILDEWDNPSVEPVLALHRQVENEIEKMRQFIRFEHVEGDMWFAQCNPSCSVVPFVMGHFARRFSTQRFAIYDEAHKLAGLSEGGRWQLVAVDDVKTPIYSCEEATMQDAWRRFYQALSIDERYHPELRRHFMPKRLWKNITEVRR